MFDVSREGIITVNRGDSFEVPMFLNAGNSIDRVGYNLTERDAVYLGVMEPNQPFEFALIRKKYTIDDIDSRGNLIIRFKPSDTACLLPGKYYYQIKLETYRSDIDDYDVETVVDKRLFYIQE